MKTKDAMNHLKQVMNKEPDYAHTWFCNISVMFQDAGGDKDIADDGASRFMKLVFDVDMDKVKQYMETG